MTNTVVNLTAKELAQRLRKTTDHLMRMRTLGTGPRFIPGRPVLYPLVEIEKWEQSRLINSTSEKIRDE